MRGETGGEGSSGVCYVVGPQAVLRLAEWGEDEQKENKELMQPVKEKEYKKIDGRTESTEIFEDSSTRRGGRGEICVAASGLRIILLFRGYKVLGGGDCVSDAFSGFGEMWPCLMMYWHPRVGEGA